MDTNIRIVIPAYNADATIKDCLHSVINSIQQFNDYEIIIVDNGLNSNLDSLTKNSSVKVIKATEKQSAAYARNIGTKEFSDGIIIFIDSDVVIEKECIPNLISPIIEGTASATIGNYSTNIENLNFAQKYKQLYINYIYSKTNTKIKNDFWTAISAIKAKTFHNLNGFDTSFKGANGEDQEFGIRLTKNNYSVYTTPAFGKHLNPYTIKKLILNDFRKGITAMGNSFNNNVSVLDNRHVNKYSIYAVVTSFMLVATIPFIYIYNFYYVPVILFFVWFTLRYSLLKIYIKERNIIFKLKSIFLAFILDLVRATAVFVAYIKK
jgi:glycosyltransferase involved in cell wall biosynthesis